MLCHPTAVTGRGPGLGWLFSCLRGPRFTATTLAGKVNVVLDGWGGRHGRRSPCPAPTPGSGSLFSPREEAPRAGGSGDRLPGQRWSHQVWDAAIVARERAGSWAEVGAGHGLGSGQGRWRWGGGVRGRLRGKPRSQGRVPGSVLQLPPSRPPADGRGEVTCVSGGEIWEPPALVRGVAGAEGASQGQARGLAEGSARHLALSLGGTLGPRRGRLLGHRPLATRAGPLAAPGSLPRSPLCRVAEGLLHPSFPPGHHV